MSYGQDNILKDMQGFSFNGNQFYELSGTDIQVITDKIPFNPKGIKKIKKIYNIMKVTQEYRDTSIHRENLVIEGIVEYKKNMGYGICYVFPKDEKETSFINFQSQFPIPPSLIKVFVNAYLEEKLSIYPTVVTETGVEDSVDFVGHTIVLGDACRYMSVNNVQCPGYGQMSWSIFENEESAKTFTQSLIEHGSRNLGASFVSSADVYITLEGIKTKAERCIYKTKFVESLLIGGKRLLCVYYVTQ